LIKKIEISHLRILDALYQCGSVSGVAEQLSISQQAVSSQLKNIRHLLGDQVFVRSGHGMIPTSYGLHIMPHVQQVLVHLNNIPVYEDTPVSEIERTFVICATDYAQEILLPLALKAIRKRAPKIKIIVTNIESVNLTKKMNQGLIDVVLTTSGYVPDGLLSVGLFTEKYRCVSANENINIDNLVSLESLVKFDFVITSPGTASFNGSADAWFQQQGLMRNVALSVPSFFMAKKYLLHSDMVGFIPSKLLPVPGLFEIPLEKYPPGYEMVAAYHQNSAKDPLLKWLVELIKENFI